MIKPGVLFIDLFYHKPKDLRGGSKKRAGNHLLELPEKEEGKTSSP
jgi:hypothetical protein